MINNGSSILKPLGYIAAGAGIGAVGGAVATGLLTSKSKKSRKKSRKKTKYYRHGRRKHKHKRKYPYTARKRKDTSHRRIRFTKRGQPYIILRSGKARFLKKSSVRRSRKRKGGKY